MQFRIFVKVMFFVFIFICSAWMGEAMASHQGSSDVLSAGTWRKSPNTIIQGKYANGVLAQDCTAFEVRLEANLKIKIECKESKKFENLLLNTQGNYTVTKNRNQITVTKFNYLQRKTRTSSLEVGAVLVPYVEEIVHIKKQINGDLAFYMEAFKVDEFGRIVQKSFIQAHGLTNKNLNISSN